MSSPSPDHDAPPEPFRSGETVVEILRADADDSRIFITSGDDGSHRVYEEHWDPWGTNRWIRHGPYHYTETLEQARGLAASRLGT